VRAVGILDGDGVDIGAVEVALDDDKLEAARLHLGEGGRPHARVVPNEPVGASLGEDAVGS